MNETILQHRRVQYRIVYFKIFGRISYNISRLRAALLVLSNMCLFFSGIQRICYLFSNYFYMSYPYKNIYIYVICQRASYVSCIYMNEAHNSNKYSLKEIWNGGGRERRAIEKSYSSVSQQVWCDYSSDKIAFFGVLKIFIFH